MSLCYIRKERQQLHNVVLKGDVVTATTEIGDPVVFSLKDFTDLYEPVLCDNITNRIGVGTVNSNSVYIKYMNIPEAREITGYEKLFFEEYNGCECEQCGTIQNRHNAGNELKTSFEYEEYNYACNKCVISMAQAVKEGVYPVVGLY